MVKLLLKHKKWVLFFVLIIFILSLTYKIRIQQLPDPNQNLLSDFAVYLNNWLMPFLTLGTVIALVITLDLQRKQINDQRKQIIDQKKQFDKQRASELFIKHINFFQKALDDYQALYKREFYIYGDKEVLRTSLFRLASLSHSYDQQVNTVDPFLELVADTRSKQAFNVRKVCAYKKDRRAMYAASMIFDDINKALYKSIYLLSKSYSYATTDDYVLIYHVFLEAKDIIDKNHIFNIISNSERNELYKQIEIPEHLAKGNLS